MAAKKAKAEDAAKVEEATQPETYTPPSTTVVEATVNGRKRRLKLVGGREYRVADGPAVDNVHRTISPATFNKLTKANQ